MIYAAYEALRQSTRPMAWLFDQGQRLAQADSNPLRDTLAMKALGLAYELPARALKDYGKPRYEIWEELGDLDIVADQRLAASLPFCDLLNFKLDDGVEKPKLLIAAALSGHHGTLLQDTIRAFANDFDTYITDWKDARQVPLEAGDFGFDDYAEYLMKFLEVLGPGTHMVATCQAAPPAMVATAMLAKRQPELVPASLTLMGGPVDTRVNPGMLNKLTGKVPFGLFEKNNVHTVPRGYPGSGRRVYPGFYQLSGFIVLNPMPHIKQYARFVKSSLSGDEAAMEHFREFYDEYFAVLDMSAPFYLETLKKVFFEHHIATGQMEFRGEKVEFPSIKNLPLLTVEGANDHLCPPGQTEAAHGVFSGVPKGLRRHYVQEGVGHYGVFSGSKFRSGIYPVIRDFAMQVSGKAKAKAN